MHSYSSMLTASRGRILREIITRPVGRYPTSFTYLSRKDLSFPVDVRQRQQRTVRNDSFQVEKPKAQTRAGRGAQIFATRPNMRKKPVGGGRAHFFEWRGYAAKAVMARAGNESSSRK
jgi:hypothetical protein